MAEHPSDKMESLVVIGSIRTPFKSPEDVPLKAKASTARGEVVVLAAFLGGLESLDEFDRIWLLYLVRSAKTTEMKVVPRLDAVARGIFSTRSLLRPNPVGLTCVKLLRIKDATLLVEGVDMLDGAALLDIKPYVPHYDAYPEAWAGWLENRLPHDGPGGGG